MPLISLIFLYYSIAGTELDTSSLINN